MRCHPGAGAVVALALAVSLLPQAPAAYNPDIFQKPLAADRLAPLARYNGEATRSLVGDKQYRKLVSGFVPDCQFHFGRDLPLADVFTRALENSNLPVRVQGGRYLMASGWSGAGRALLWMDLQDGIALGAFYFHPTNGEPTPTVTVFSRQVKTDALAITELPPVFASDLYRWSGATGIPPVTTRYFISGSNKKIALLHDEDYCALPGASPAGCQQLNADAADTDLNAAYYLKQTGYAPNATARMIVGADETTWLHLRENTCRVDPDPLRCRIRLTHEHVRVIVGHRPSPPRRPHP